MEFVLRNITVNKRFKLQFLSPKKDDTVFGTFGALHDDEFKFDRIDFQEGDVVLDLGCNIGVISCIIGYVFPFVNVYGFDASPLSCNLARANAILNQLKNVTIFNKAIGKENRSNVRFYSNSKEITCLMEDELVGFTGERRDDVYLCNIICLDEIFNSKLLGINKVKFLKCDIEGAEFEVFYDLFNRNSSILDKIEYLHLEIHNFKEFDPDLLLDKVRGKFRDKLLSSLLVY